MGVTSSVIHAVQFKKKIIYNPKFMAISPYWKITRWLCATDKFRRLCELVVRCWTAVSCYLRQTLYMITGWTSYHRKHTLSVLAHLSDMSQSSGGEFFLSLTHCELVCLTLETCGCFPWRQAALLVFSGRRWSVLFSSSGDWHWSGSPAPVRWDTPEPQDCH